MAPIPKDWNLCRTTHGSTLDGTFVAFKMPINATNWDVPDVLEALPNIKCSNQATNSRWNTSTTLQM